MDLVLFHGGYSIGSASERTVLSNGKRYLVDGTQKLFLMVSTNAKSNSGKPYFSLAIKKLANLGLP